MWLPLKKYIYIPSGYITYEVGIKWDLYSADFFFKGNRKPSRKKKPVHVNPFEQCSLAITESVKDHHVATTKWQPKSWIPAFSQQWLRVSENPSINKSQEYRSGSITEPRELHYFFFLLDFYNFAILASCILSWRMIEEFSEIRLEDTDIQLMACVHTWLWSCT